MPGVLSGRIPAAGAVLALVTTAPSLAAQQVKVRFSGVHADYANRVTGSAGTFTTELRWANPGIQTTLDGSYSQFTTGPWVVQGAGNSVGLRFVGPDLAVGYKLDGDGGYLSDGLWSGTGLAGPVVAYVPDGWLLFGSLAAGGMRRIDRAGLFTVAGNATVHRDIGPWGVQLGGSFTRAGPVHFADATFGTDMRVSTVTLGVAAGARAGDLTGPPWYQARATVELTRAASLELSGGSYPRDVSGFIGGSFVSIGIWVGLGRHARVASTSDVIRRFASGSSSLTVESPAPGRQQVTFHVPGARTVAIAGEWNDWTPTDLQRLDDGRWRADLALSQGAHRFSLVVDGSKWVVPPGVATLPDDMGGKVGLLIVDQ